MTRNNGITILKKVFNSQVCKCCWSLTFLFPVIFAHAQTGGIQVKKIWDKAPYNSFTSLIRFDDAFYCSFREGTSHVSDKNDGKVRILRSEDGDHWGSIALLKVHGLDLRDPKLSVTPDHKIMVIMAGAVFYDHRKIRKLFPMVSFSDTEGKDFSAPEKATLAPGISPDKDWIWRVTWHNGTGYGVDYHTVALHRNSESSKEEAIVTLVKTDNGQYFKKVSNLPVKDFPNESTIRFNKNNEMFVLVRRDAGNKMGVLLKSRPPYTHWRCKQLKIQLGGPDFLFLNDTRLVIGTRHYLGKRNTTAIFVTNLKGRILKDIELPSGGDTGYPGMVIYKNLLWVSYYSSHEGKAGIYLAKISLSML
ncbi:MAG: hypothetical protein EPN37_07865 [Chitinophagaceae bacterium]|nr:MAG: hypothetical protein EPN37_07865 [Chitinophagaceae bacterium]